MYHFIYDSLGPMPQKKIATKLDEIDEDGPTLLKVVLDDTFSAMMITTFSIREKFHELNLKKYRWNVQLLNQDVREKRVDLLAAGMRSDESDMIFSLFKAYSTSTNEEFKQTITYWKNEYTSGVWTTAEDLMVRAEAKYIELRDLGTWGKKSPKDDQIIALTSKVSELEGSEKKDGSGKKKNKGKAVVWKLDKKLSKTNELQCNDKTYHWCTGPGHGGTGMWVVHAPGTCTASKKNKGSKKDSNQNSGALSHEALAAALKASGDLSDDEVQSKLEAILAVIWN